MVVCAHCGVDVDPDAIDCDVCRKPLDARPVERIGDRLKVLRDARLPPVCYRCGAPPRPDEKPKTFYWHEPALYLLILAGALVYVIVALIVRKRFDVVVPECEAHFQARMKKRNVAFALYVAAGASVVLAFAGKDAVGWGCLGAVLCTLSGLIVHALAQRTLLPKRITDDWADFAGAGPEFLAVLD